MLELRECVTDRFGQSFVEVAHHLPELHQRAFHGAELSDDVVGMAQLERPVQLLAPLRRGEDALRPVDGFPAAGPRTEPREACVPAGERARHDR